MSRKEGLYAIYKGDTFIDVGTAKELARSQGIKIETVRFYASGASKRRAGTSTNRLEVFRVE